MGRPHVVGAVTAVFAFRHAGGVTIASDSLISDDACVYVEDVPKYWRAGRLVIGAAGGVRATILAQAIPPLRAQRASETDHVYLTTVLAEAVRAMCAAAECKTGDLSLVVIHRGQPWVVDDDLGVMSPASGFVSIGSASHVVHGALAWSLRHSPELAPQARAESILALAKEHCVGVGGPSHVLTVRRR